MQLMTTRSRPFTPRSKTIGTRSISWSTASLTPNATTSGAIFQPQTAKGSELHWKSGGSVVTLTFDASQRVYPGYNIMGTAKAALENEMRQLAVEFGDRNIRVNAISAGPLPTLAARSIPGFRDMTRAHRERSPLGRNINHSEVANTALFLLSDMASGITGAIIPVDAGYGIVAL